MHRDDDPGRDGFEEMLRSMVREVSRSFEQVAQGDLHEAMAAIGVDPVRARELVDGAAEWLRARTGGLEDDRVPRGTAATEDTADVAPRRAGPHPLDLSTDQQGEALAALDSGRWTVEPGSEMFVTRGGGPAPEDALGLVGELRARDWITADGDVTLAGHNALGRWMDIPKPR
jgi:hypothetical protein